MSFDALRAFLSDDFPDPDRIDRNDTFSTRNDPARATRSERDRDDPRVDRHAEPLARALGEVLAFFGYHP